MGLLVTLGILVALALLPLGVSLRYDADGFRGYALAGLVRIPITKKTEDKHEKTAERKQKSQKKDKKSHSSSAHTEKKGGDVENFLPRICRILDFLDAFRRKLRIRRLEMKLIMAADDPCDLAINYGRAWAALGSLIPQLERCFVVRKRNLEVECDFEATKTFLIARLDLTITLGRLLLILLRHGIGVVKEYLNMKNLRKGGAPK